MGEIWIGSSKNAKFRGSAHWNWIDWLKLAGGSRERGDLRGAGWEKATGNLLSGSGGSDPRGKGEERREVAIGGTRVFLGFFGGFH